MNKVQCRNVFKKQKDPFFASTITYLIIMLAFVGVRIFAQQNFFEPLGDFESLAYSLIIQVGIIFGLSFVLFKGFSGYSTKQIFGSFHFKKISFKAVLICVGIAVCLFVLNSVFSSIYGYILEIFGYQPISSPITSYSLPLFLLALFSTAVLPGFCEEFANRGVLLHGIKNLGAKKAIIISGLLFGLMHFNIGQFGYAFLVGMLFAYLVLATGSIVPGMIIHFLNNAIVEYITFARVNGLPFGNYYAQFSAFMQGDFLSSMIFIFVILFSIILLFAWLVYLLIQETRAKKLAKLSSDLAENLEETLPSQGVPIKIGISPQRLGFNIFTKQTLFPSLKAKIPMYSAIFLGAVVTLMTLIWNTL